MRRKGLFNGTLDLDGGPAQSDAGQFLANQPNHRAAVAAIDRANIPHAGAVRSAVLVAFIQGFRIWGLRER